LAIEKVASWQVVVGKVREQLSAAQEEMNEWRNQAHQSQSAFDRLQDQLAKAEQRVAEACALQVATDTKFHWLDAARVAKEIRSGEWRKFVKEM
jgi:predicted  nucleic acid-binding Zn-ribbon protein